MSNRVVAFAAATCVLSSLLAAHETRASSGSSDWRGYQGDAFMVDTGVTPMPPDLSQYSYGAASNGSGWRVMWANQYDSSVNTSGIGADGSLLDSYGGVVGHDGYMMAGPTRSIVGTGSGFIAVWTSRSSPSWIWASRLDSSGAVVESLPIFQGTSDQVRPSVAFDGDSTCLVAWQAANDVYAARLTLSGQVLDTNPLPVAADPSRREWRPAAAFGQGVYLVAWTSRDSLNRQTARARRVSASGVLLDTAILLRRDTAMTQAWTSVAFGDTCFLAAWSEGTLRHDIYAARVSVSGKLIDSAGMQLCSGPLDDRSPSVGFDGTRYLVMWNEMDPSAPNHFAVCGRRVAADGVPLDTGLIRPGPPGYGCTSPSVAADQANFLVAFCTVDTLTLDENGCCARISPDGVVLDSGLLFPLGADAQTNPSGASDGTDFLAAWTESRPHGQMVVQAARIAADGSLLDPVGFTVNDEPGAKSNVATGFGDSLYLVAWADNRSASGYDIYCARVNRAGQVLDTAGIAVCDETLSQARPGISFDGQNFLITWADYRSGAKGDIYAARVRPDGVVLDPDGFAVDADTLEDAMPVVCFADSSYLVVWEEAPSWQGPYDIYGALVSRAGAVVKPRFGVSRATGDQMNPAVARGPANSLVAWDDARQGPYYIYAARVGADGTVLDTSGIAVDARYGNERMPRLTFDNAGFRMLWHRWAPSSGTVFTAGRVDTAGKVSYVADWFAVPGSDLSSGYGAVYGSGPDLLVLFSSLTDTALGRHYGNYRLWGKLGDVPGIEHADDIRLRRVACGASVVRGVLFMPLASGVGREASSVLLDISGRKVLSLHCGANDLSRLSPGVYFVREEVHANAARKVVVQR